MTGRGRPRIGKVRETVIPDDLWNRTLAEAARRGVSAAEINRRALTLYLDIAQFDPERLETDDSEQAFRTPARRAADIGAEVSVWQGCGTAAATAFCPWKWLRGWADVAPGAAAIGVALASMTEGWRWI